jgi:hypothetical protein
MSKEKKRERDRLRQIIDSLQVDPATAPIEDIDEALAGEDVTRLRTRLFQQAHEIATAQRRQGIPVSRALQKFIDSMNDGPALPADRNDAFTKAVEQFAMPAAVSLGSTPRQLEAYRKGDKDLTEKDKTILKDAAERLRKHRDEKKK